MTEKSLVFGSSGFLGSKLSQLLEQSGHQVIKGPRNGEVNPLWVDYIFFCQAFGNYYWQKDNILETYQANVQSLARVLQNGELTKGIVYVSSSSAGLEHQTFYSASKRAGEEMVYLAARDKKVPVVSMRPSSITGVGEQKEHLIPKLIDSALHGTKMDFVGEPTHDFVDVSDVARAMLVLARVAGERKGEVFNVSSGVSTSNEEILAVVEDYSGSKANINRVSSLRPYDTKDWKVDNSKMLELGWKPEVSLRQSIEMMIYKHPNTPSSLFVELDRKYGHQ